MILAAHIVIAITSIAYTAYALVRPTVSKLRWAYALAAMTLASGTYLVISSPAHMVQSCIMGLTYFGFVSIGLILARRRLLT